MTLKPDLRTLKATLRALREEGVTEYEDGSGLKIRFGDPVGPPPAQVAGDDPNRELELPEGVVDPVKMLEKINRRSRVS